MEMQCVVFFNQPTRANKNYTLRPMSALCMKLRDRFKVSVIIIFFKCQLNLRGYKNYRYLYHFLCRVFSFLSLICFFFFCLFCDVVKILEMLVIRFYGYTRCELRANGLRVGWSEFLTGSRVLPQCSCVSCFTSYGPDVLGTPR